MKTFFENKGRRFLFCEVLFNQGHRSRTYDEIFYHFRKSRGPWASRTFANQGPHTVLHVGDQTIDPSVNGRNLGTIFDNSNSMDTHINQVFFTIFTIFVEFLNTFHRNPLTHFYSRLDYCNSLLYGLPKYHISRLQRVQNAAELI